MKDTNGVGFPGFTKLSESIANPLIKVYKTGKLGLVFIFIGLLLVVFAQFNTKNPLNISLFILGSLLVFISFLLFLFLQLNNPLLKQKNIREDKELADNLQALSINLVILTGKAQALSFKYLTEIDNFLSKTLPVIQALPLVPAYIKNASLQIRDVQSSVVDLFNDSEQLIRDVEKALITSDINKFRFYSQEVEKLSKQISEILKS